MRYLTKAIAAFDAGGFAAIYLIPASAQERGYSGAYGGEWVLIFAAAAIAAWIVDEIFKKGDEHDEQNRRVHTKR